MDGREEGTDDDDERLGKTREGLRAESELLTRPAVLR
jgi:hypothetical protein